MRARATGSDFVGRRGNFDEELGYFGCVIRIGGLGKGEIAIWCRYLGIFNILAHKI